MLVVPVGITSSMVTKYSKMCLYPKYNQEKKLKKMFSQNEGKIEYVVGIRDIVFGRARMSRLF